MVTLGSRYHRDAPHIYSYQTQYISTHPTTLINVLNNSGALFKYVLMNHIEISKEMYYKYKNEK